MLLSFREFAKQAKSRRVVKEHLDPHEYDRFRHFKIDPEMREKTDGFFGKGKDVIHRDIPELDEKSDTHKAIEKHLGKEIPIEHYRAGTYINDNGNPRKLSKAIKDPELLKNFTSDPSRSNKNSKKFTMSFHRGTYVAGQTHPRVHSWGNESCKNLDSGCNRHYLPSEIERGSVVAFLHDHNGKEISRATLHPYHNGEHTVYGVNSLYGLKHPAFVKHVHQVASELSGPHDESKPTIYDIDGDVYNNGASSIIHPNIPPEGLEKTVKESEYPDTDHILDTEHKSFTPDMIHRLAQHFISKNQPRYVSKLLNQPNVEARTIRNIHDKNLQDNWLNNILGAHEKTPVDILENLAKEHLNLDAIRNERLPTHVLDHIAEHHPDHIDYVLQNPNHNEHHVRAAMEHNYGYTREKAAASPKISNEDLEKAVDSDDKHLNLGAARNQKLSHEQFTILHAKHDGENGILGQLLANNNLHPDSWNDLINSGDLRFLKELEKQHLLRNPSLTSDHIHKILAHPNYGQLSNSITNHQNFNESHFKPALQRNGTPFQMNAAASNLANHPNMTWEHFQDLLNDKDIPNSTRQALKKEWQSRVNREEKERMMDDNW